MREFLKQAVDSFHAAVGKADGVTAIEASMPWKIGGEAWHLGDKGFPPGKKPKWDRALLAKLLQFLKETDSNIEVKYDIRDAITVRLPGISRYWVRIKTKEIASLEAWFVAPPGKFNGARFEGIGPAAVVEGDRAEGCDLVKLHFVLGEQLDAKKLLPLLKELRQRFDVAFGD